MNLSDTSDYRDGNSSSDNYYKIAYEEEKNGGNLEKQDVKHLLRRFKKVEGKLRGLNVMGCLLIFLVCVHLMCDFLSPSHTEERSKSGESCEAGWFNGKFVELGCLKFSVNMTSYEDAKTYCEKENAFLIELNQQAQVEVLVNIMEVLEESQGKSLLWWAGGSKLAEDGSWTWSQSGRPIEDWVWAQGQPDKAADHDYLCFHYAVDFRGDDCYNNTTWGKALCQKNN